MPISVLNPYKMYYRQKTPIWPKTPFFHKQNSASAEFYNNIINITPNINNAEYITYSSSEAQCNVALFSRVHNLHLEVVAPCAEWLASLSESHIHDAFSLSYILQQL